MESTTTSSTAVPRTLPQQPQQRATPVLWFGFDASLIAAVSANVWSWLLRSLLLRPGTSSSLLVARRPVADDGDASPHQQDFALDDSDDNDRTMCVSIERPGGLEQLRWVRLPTAGVATVGYNVPGQQVPFTVPLTESRRADESSSTTTASVSSGHQVDSESTTIRYTLPDDDCVLMDNYAFSVNYADCCIRWGLYESANRYVGYPIVPGFDVAGIVKAVGGDGNGDDESGSVAVFKAGDRVFGCTLFGAYSTRVLVPTAQLRHVPKSLTLAQAASLPTVSITALYALYLAGQYSMPPSSSQRLNPTNSSSTTTTTTAASSSGPSLTTNRSILIHSAAGGVGSMLVQMASILGLHPIVGVVGRPDKVPVAKALGCHVVVHKKSSSTNWWDLVRNAAPPDGYATIMDPNGVETLRQSYDHLAPTGRLVVYGFHTNLPMNQDQLNPWEWIKMAWRSRNMPSLDVMDLVQSNKSVMGFNLSFLATERDLLAALFDQVLEWLDAGLVQCPNIVEMHMNRVDEAHQRIQSGTSVGKIVLTRGMMSGGGPNHEVPTTDYSSNDTEL